ncbi:MAG: GDP-mannose 4,6-dehydratase [Actinomycetota bacterium]
MRVLVTGASGFVGAHLVPLLQGSGHEVVATSLLNADRLDVEDPSSIESVLSKQPIDAVIHLAAQASVPVSWEDPSATYRTNILGTSNLLQGMHQHGIPKVLLVGSAQQYEPKETPLREVDPLLGMTPYSLSKIAQEQIGLMMHQRYGMQVLIARSFNHTGPGQGPHYSVGAFCHQIVEIERGTRDKKMKVGYLGARRDFLDVRDVVGAYLRIIEDGNAGEVYNVCSGEALEIREILETLIGFATVGDVEIEEDSDPRPGDPAMLVGDGTKILSQLGWRPKIPMKESLRDTLDWYREKGEE